jgi:hypothetical protein
VSQTEISIPHKSSSKTPLPWIVYNTMRMLVLIDFIVGSHYCASSLFNRLLPRNHYTAYVYRCPFWWLTPIFCHWRDEYCTVTYVQLFIYLPSYKKSPYSSRPPFYSYSRWMLRCQQSNILQSVTSPTWFAHVVQHVDSVRNGNIFQGRWVTWPNAKFHKITTVFDSLVWG